MSNQNIIKNQIENSLTKKGDENNENTNEKGQYENLAFNSKLILDVNEIPLRKDSETPQIKFSIDLPNAPKQRLHEYLNNDLINALDNNLSNPSTPLLNNPNLPQNQINNNNMDNIPQISLNDDFNHYQNNNNMNNNYNIFNQQMKMNMIQNNMLNHMETNIQNNKNHNKEK